MESVQTTSLGTFNASMATHRGGVSPPRATFMAGLPRMGLLLSRPKMLPEESKPLGYQTFVDKAFGKF